MHIQWKGDPSVRNSTFLSPSFNKDQPMTCRLPSHLCSSEVNHTHVTHVLLNPFTNYLLSGLNGLFNAARILCYFHFLSSCYCSMVHYSLYARRNNYTLSLDGALMLLVLLAYFGGKIGTYQNVCLDFFFSTDQYLT